MFLKNLSPYVTEALMSGIGWDSLMRRLALLKSSTVILLLPIFPFISSGDRAAMSRVENERKGLLRYKAL